MSDMGWDLCPTTLGVVIDGFWRQCACSRAPRYRACCPHPSPTLTLTLALALTRYRLPILVTESGTADGDLHDKRRVRYLSG